MKERIDKTKERYFNNFSHTLILNSCDILKSQIILIYFKFTIWISQMLQYVWLESIDFSLLELSMW
jgi:hypothetical protein